MWRHDFKYKNKQKIIPSYLTINDKKKIKEKVKR